MVCTVVAASIFALPYDEDSDCGILYSQWHGSDLGVAEHQPLDDRGAVAAIADRYRSAVLAFFNRRLTDRQEAEDLTQEVFTSLLRRAELETIDNVEGYIFQVAANLLRYRGRLAGRRPDLRGGDYEAAVARLSDDLSPERIALGREACALATQALQELPERARTIFVLNRFEDMTGREIAIRLGVSVSTVEKDMIKAVAFLRDRLG